MSWFVIAFLLAFAGMYFLQRKHWRDAMKKNLTYRFEFSTDEVFVGEYLYLDQVVENTGDHPISFLKMETLLPEGLKVVLTADEGKKRDETVQSVQSVFILPAHGKVSRRWRIVTETRGHYTARTVQMHVISHDAIGMDTYSMRMQPTVSAKDHLTVLPVAAEWLTQMALAPSYTGDRHTQRGLVQDPLSICGIREYQPTDPLNMMDWKQTARMGEMMVRLTDIQQNDSYHIVLNMQSTIIEPNYPEISTPAYVEDCISLCASLLDSAIRRNIPVRLMANIDPNVLPHEKPNETANEEVFGSSVHEGELGKHIFASEQFNDKSSVIEAYRILAKLPMRLSLPTERLLQDILEHPFLYAQNGHIVFVTSFVDQRMVNFHRAMAEQGINVIFYVMTSYQNAPQMPSEVEAYFRYSRWTGGVGYAS